MSEKKYEILKAYRRLLEGERDHITREMMSLYINFYRELSDSERSYFQQHLSDCPECQKKFAEVFDTEIELEDTQTLHLLEEKQSVTTPVTAEMYFFTSQIDRSNRTQIVRSLDDRVILQFLFEKDRIRLKILEFPEQFGGNPMKIFLPELEATARIIMVSGKAEIEIFSKKSREFPEIKTINMISADKTEETDLEISLWDRFGLQNIQYPRLAAAVVVLFMITILYFILVPDKPGPDQPLISQQILPEKFQNNPILENFIGRTTRSEHDIKILLPKNGDTLRIPISFRWTSEAEGQEYTVTILSNKNRELWRKSVRQTEFVFSETLSPGLYYWKLQTGQQAPLVQKFYLK